MPESISSPVAEAAAHPIDASTPQAPATETNDVNNSKELINTAGAGILIKEIKKTQDEVKRNSPEEAKKMLSENPSKTALATIGLLKDEQWNSPEDGLTLTAENSTFPIIIVRDGKEITLNTITGSTEDNFTVITANNSEIMDISRAEIVAAYEVARREDILSEIPDSQKEVVSKYLDSLESSVLGKENPLDSTSSDELISLAKDAQKAQEDLDPEKVTPSESSDEVKVNKSNEDIKMESNWRILNESGATFIVGHHDFVKNYYSEHYREFQPKEKASLKAEIQKLGRDLTPEESSIISMKVVATIQEGNANFYPETAKIEVATQSWIQNEIKRTGEHPSLEEVKMQRKKLKLLHGNQDDFNTILSREIIDAAEKKLSKKDWAIFIAFIIATLGKDITSDFLPKS